MTSEPPEAPVIVSVVTVSAGRVDVVPPEVTEMSPPDEFTVTAPVAETVHASRNVIFDDALVSTALAPDESVSAVDALTLVEPYAAFVTCTEHVPSAAVVHVPPPLSVAPPVAANVTVAPAAGAPPFMTVALTVAEAPALS